MCEVFGPASDTGPRIASELQSGNREAAKIRKQGKKGQVEVAKESDSVEESEEEDEGKPKKDVSKGKHPDMPGRGSQIM